jgi:hypothetical protein
MRLHFQRKGILHKARFFPYVMYLARAASDRSPAWTRGRYEPTCGHFVRYEKEFRSARAFATIIRSRADWEKGQWRLFKPESFAPPQLPMLRRLWHICKYFYHERTLLLPALARSGQLDRLVRHVRRATH